MSRVGVFGGTFNPPHIGHLICAQEALTQLELERIIFVPTGEPPHKQIEADPGRELRHRLCLFASERNDRFEISRLELDREGPSYTAVTLEMLHEELKESELNLIVGGDMAATLPLWHRPDEIVRLSRLAVAERSGVERSVIEQKLAPLGAVTLEYFTMPRIDISSSLVRDRVKEGLPINYLVPERVAELIESEGLYH